MSQIGKSYYKVYLGDSVYVRMDRYGGIVLTTENGLPDDPSNMIVLEPEVYMALVMWVRSLRTGVTE
jgi:hypothetical protein